MFSLLFSDPGWGLQCSRVLLAHNKIYPHDQANAKQLLFFTVRTYLLFTFSVGTFSVSFSSKKTPPPLTPVLTCFVWTHTFLLRPACLFLSPCVRWIDFLIKYLWLGFHNSGLLWRRGDYCKRQRWSNHSKPTLCQMTSLEEGGVGCCSIDYKRTLLVRLLNNAPPITFPGE